MTRARGDGGAVFGSVIMKNRNTSTSGEVISTHQKWRPPIGPRCQRAVISCPAAASTASPAANATQNDSATRSSFRRDRIEKPPVTITTSANTSHHDVGPHQK